MKFKSICSVLLLLVSMSGFSDLVPMSDNALSRSTGQSLVLIEETNHAQANGDVYDFNRITVGLKIEINATIDEIKLGTYNRGQGANCTGNGSFCDNTSGTYRAWNCSVSQCGGITNDPDYNKNTLAVSPLIYGDLFKDAGVDYSAFNVALGALGLNSAGPYAENVIFDSSNGKKLFPSGFTHTPGTDLALHDVTLGRIIDNGDGSVQTIEDFVFEDPYFEFAYNATGEIVGLRTGFGIADGVQGNAIDVFSGFVKPVVTATAEVEVAFLTGEGTFTFAPYLGGVRTPGYIDPDPTKSELVGTCAQSGALGGTVCSEVDEIGKVAHASPQAQLFPLQALELDQSPAFWLSIQSEEVDYPDQVVMRRNADTGVMEEVTYNYEAAKAGVWFNLGALEVHADGGKVDIANIAQYTGLSVKTTQPLHPDNYFNTNPNNGKYPQGNNYY